MSEQTKHLPGEAPVVGSGHSCEVEASPYPRRAGFVPPTEEEIRRDAGIAPDDDGE